MVDPVVVIKQNWAGQEAWRYSGEAELRRPDAVKLWAPFNRADLLFRGILLKQGDLFYEIYYTNRWYNIYEIYDRDDHQIKCWYCNIARPCVIEGSAISFADMALDLLVHPDGRQEVLDEDEFDALALDEPLRQQAWQAMNDLQAVFRQHPGGSLVATL